MNEDLEQGRLPIHVFTHRRLRDMINRNQRRLATSANYITQNYNRFFNTDLTPNEFLNTINQDMVDELAERQIDPAQEGERRRLLVEIDRYRKIKAILREVRAVLMIIKYNRLSKERRRLLNNQHLSETGLTFIEDIDRTMPVYPFYFRGLRTVIPQDTTSPVRFNSVYYDQYRLLGGNVVTLGGVLPETLVNPVLITTPRRTIVTEIEETQGVHHGHTRDFADDHYDLDDLRPTGREREESIRHAEERNRELENRERNNEQRDTGRTTPARPEPPTDTRTNRELEAELEMVRSIAHDLRFYQTHQELSYNDAIAVRQLIESFDERNINNHGLVLDALGRDYPVIEDIVTRLRVLLEQYDRGQTTTTPTPTTQENEADKVRASDVEREATVEELQRVNPDVSAEAIRRAVELGNYILRIRYRENPNTIDEIEGLLDEYDQLRLNPETAAIARSMLTLDPRIGKKIDRFRMQLNDLTFRNRIENGEIKNPEPEPITNVERLREMINELPDPSLIIFNRDVEGFHRMARIVELYHVVRPEIRFNESPVMRISEEGKLTRAELAKLKRIIQTYGEIYRNPEIREAFITHRSENKQL